MTTQPEALRLAEILMSRAAMTTDQRVSTAAELRRLHAQRDALLEALKAMLHMVERHAPVGLAPTQDSPVAKARAAIAKSEDKQ